LGAALSAGLSPHLGGRGGRAQTGSGEAESTQLGGVLSMVQVWCESALNYGIRGRARWPEKYRKGG